MSKSYEYQYDKGVLPNIGSMISQTVAPAGLKSWGDLNAFQQAPGPKRPGSTPAMPAKPKTGQDDTIPPHLRATMPDTPVTNRPQTVQTPGKWVEDTTSPLAEFRSAQYARDGLGPTNYNGPQSIEAKRQANGVMSFSAVGTPGAQGGVRYTGTPDWTSKRGGAGQGTVDFGGDAFKPAQAAIADGRGALSGASSNPFADKVNGLIEAISSGSGGAVGVAQNKIALQALAPLMEREMQNKNSTSIAKMETETRRRGQDLGLSGEMARVGASIYGTDVAARTAKENTEVEKERNALTLSIAKAKASGNPQQMMMAQLLGLEFAAKTGIDPNTGKVLPDALRDQLYRKVLEMKAPTSTVPYGGFGMYGAETDE